MHRGRNVHSGANALAAVMASMLDGGHTRQVPWLAAGFLQQRSRPGLR